MPYCEVCGYESDDLAYDNLCEHCAELESECLWCGEETKLVNMYMEYCSFCWLNHAQEIHDLNGLQYIK